MASIKASWYIEKGEAITKMAPSMGQRFVWEYQKLENVDNNKNKLRLSWAKLNSSLANYARCASCFQLDCCLTLRSSSIEVVFHWGRLPLRSSSIEVVFHWGCLPFMSSFIEVVVVFYIYDCSLHFNSIFIYCVSFIAIFLIFCHCITKFHKFFSTGVISQSTVSVSKFSVLGSLFCVSLFSTSLSF